MTSLLHRIETSEDVFQPIIPTEDNMIQEFEDDYRPPETTMYAYHKSTASIGDESPREWACVSGTIHNTDDQAIEAAQKEFGGSWIMPYFVKKPEDWKMNPKPSRDKRFMLWLLVRG